MLEEVIVDNYKSLINLVFRPRDQNLLIGVNNAGKTNLCQAMSFLAGTAQLPLDACADTFASGRHAITNHYFAKRTIDFGVRAVVPFQSERLTFRYNLTISLSRDAPAPFPTLEVDKETLSVTGPGFDDVTLLENTRDGVRLLHEVDYVRGQQNYVKTSAPREATMLFRLYDMETNARANCFKKYLCSWQYYALSPDAMRGFQHYPNQVILNSDGRNLASAIYHLKTTNERRYRQLIRQLQEVAPEVELINFTGAPEGTIVMVLEDKKGNGLPAANVSSGTLRFLALVYILLAQPEYAGNPLIMIEEPENGVYVGFLKSLLEMTEEVESRPQLVFTSHSPYFIDLFDSRLDSIFVIKRGEHHSSIAQPDPEKIKNRLENFSLGDQHFREMLG